MDIITCDFETYYAKDFSLSKLTTEEYIRDPRFQVIGVGTKVNDGPVEHFTGPPMDTVKYLHSFDWKNSALLSHNTMFDGAILSWRCGIMPKAYMDTMNMSRALDGVDARHSLKAVAERYGIGVKGDEVMQAIGKRRQDFTDEELRRYMAYCENDVDLCYEIFKAMVYKGFPQEELKLIDLTLRMFTDPVLQVDRKHLEAHLADTRERKQALIDEAGVDKKALMSNNKFAELLRELGVTPPMKISPTTGKETYAFAKTDEGMRELAEHEDPNVQALVAARTGNKSTLEETRTERFINIGKRGSIPVPVRYYAAHTGRWGGADKINFQNLPSRGANANQIKKGVVAPEGYMLIDADSSQIEARVLAWLAGQDDLVEAFRNKDDVYKLMAGSIYQKEVDDIDGGERFVGKTTILGCGYGMGAAKFGLQLANFGVEVGEAEAQRIINVYRSRNSKITDLWHEAGNALLNIVNGGEYSFGRGGLIEARANASPFRAGLILPNGLPIYYDKIRRQRNEEGRTEYVFDTRKGPSRIYGGKVIENVCQALARIIIGHQMIDVAKQYKVVLTVHDSIVVCVPEEELDEAQAYVEACMRKTPPWAEGLPLDCESSTGKSYGECK